MVGYAEITKNICTSYITHKQKGSSQVKILIGKIGKY